MLLKYRFSVAPMMDYTDRHCRYFMRLITRRALLYTEMITANAILYGDAAYFLKFHPAEHPVAVQLGGSDPQKLALAAKIAAEYGYDEINLNVGCPSSHVTEGHFGVCLMKDPALVAECVRAMQHAVKIPVTVKTRIGVDEYDSDEFLQNFIAKVAEAGCNTFIIHARKAWLQGLSPKENREIPPLHYEAVYQLKQNFPALQFIINGGIKTLAQAEQLLAVHPQGTQLEGVMMGREPCHNPYMLAEVDKRFYNDSHPILSRQEIMQHYLSYVALELQAGTPLHYLTKPVLGLFHGVPGARLWRRFLTENAHNSAAGLQIFNSALSLLA